jgi:hypothetical protein
MVEKIKANFNKVATVGGAGVITALATAVPTFAADSTTGITFSITNDMLSPITSAISSGLTTLVPVGLAVMGAMVGISLIPRIIYKFL